MKQIRYKNSLFLSILLTLLLLMNLSCKKFIEIPLPENQLTSDFVFTNDQAAIETITGIYSKMMENTQRFSSCYTTFFAGMSADELYYYTPGIRDEFVTDQITNANSGTIESGFWSPAYSYIYAANKSIEGILASSSLSPSVRSMVTGEARFIRAFCYFYLVNLFGDVPLILSTDYQETQSIPRTPTAIVYAQIVNDLKDAEASLSSSYSASNRVRPNKYAASALLARVYLYIGDWANAEAEASLVINSGNYALVSDLNTAFKINSNETIWQLQPVFPSRNTWEGYQVIPSSNSSTPTYLLTNSLVSSFEANDNREISWMTSRVFSGQTLYYPYKYKVKTGSTLTECYVVLRLAEQYLIRAETRAQQNNNTGSQEDINIIRNRAGLPNTTAASRADLLTAIEQERKVELFAEWGHRWFDLKRTNRANAVLGALKPLTWQPTAVLWPIPQTELNLNPSLTQNPGY